MLRKLFKFIRNVTIGVGIFILAAWIFFAQPTLSSNSPSGITVNTERLRAVVKKLSIDLHPRAYRNTENLHAAADYIAEHFQQAGGEVEFQEFVVSGMEVKNVRCFIGDKDQPRIVIGAHYDAHSGTPGADDNASGVAGLIELAYLLQSNPSPLSVELVAYTLEEPPFFATDKMGSHVHAESVANQKDKIIGMIALEMIGYFSEESGSQEYPALLFDLIYPNTGDFIAVIGKLDQRTFISDLKVGMKGSTELDVYSISAPTKVPGIDFSDHRNYWTHDIDAMMVTDTAFYRNKEYHKPNDTWDRLNYDKMANVVRSIHNAIVSGDFN